MSIEISKLMSIFESILFASGEAVSTRTLCDIADVERNDALSALKQMTDTINSDSARGIKLIKLDDKYQFCTKDENGEFVRKALITRKNSPLSNAALEVLAIISYNQPVTKAYIEQVRGVECSQVIANLAAKNLVEEKGRLDAPGRPLLYGTTTEFLRCFNISSLNQLPELPNIDGEKNVFQQEAIPGTED